MKKEIRTVKTNRGFKEYTYLGCPLTRNRSAWCYRLCAPDGEGHGRCGRVAPHSIKSYIQLAIEKHNKKLQKIHFEKLTNLYLSSADRDDLEPGIRISEGAAEIFVSIPKEPNDNAGNIDSSFYFKAMTDASLYAVNSLIDDALIAMVNFNTYLTRPGQKGEFIIKGRFVGMSGDNFLAEAVITDAEGREIARGNGAFMKSDISLASASGYQ
jgi:acyl-coenzyme A thioesterase PaaI-like protein